MIINHNSMASNALRQLNVNQANQAKSMAKLSSGLRINTAADDAAGLAISEKMKGQIRGLDQASRNAQDGQSMINTAEGALSQTTDILQRMRELATQASNDTNTSTDRTQIQKEFNQLTSEVNRIGNTTQFNTQNLLQGTGMTSTNATLSGATLTGGANASSGTVTTSNVAPTTNLSGINAGTSVTFSVDGTSYSITNANLKAAFGGGKTNVDVENAINSATTGGGVALSTVANVSLNASGQIVIASKTTGTTSSVGFSITDGSGGADTATLQTAFGISNATSNSGANAKTATGTLSFNGVPTAGSSVNVNGTQVDFYDSTKGSYSGSNQHIDVSTLKSSTDAATALAGLSIVGVSLAVDGTNKSQVNISASTPGAAGNNDALAQSANVGKDFTANFQIGANSQQSFTIDFKDMRSQALNISGTTGGTTIKASNGQVATLQQTSDVTNGTSSTDSEFALDLSNNTNATAAISVLDDAINSVSTERAKMGAYSNRLDNTINNLNTTSQNISDAQSRVADVDMAKEMMNQSKASVLAQAAQAMLAQANQQPQQVLQLLRG